ncbi:MAG: hypothetical protein ACTHYF_00040 [Ruoffia tabacinasalis]|uniref:Uncharacterized protein n=1 Tax=Ruoffia tabacinasalis TaxID=87458 RepID=A0ABS0LMD3_9LACT|nr:hypothetical protein [Ruoffia tabacinasalis]MBG9979309.1 hypothetical protein [Ruoffia tabacinasalis]HBY90025.1 hypothetical protein [Aerococcaceae bacterium]
MKKYKILLTGLLIATFVLPTSVAKAFENNNEINISSNIIEPLDVRRMWIEMHPVSGNGPATFYYHNGYWHGYLQKVGFTPRPNSMSYYSGYVYPVDSAIPIPSKAPVEAK